MALPLVLWVALPWGVRLGLVGPTGVVRPVGCLVECLAEPWGVRSGGLFGPGKTNPLPLPIRGWILLMRLLLRADRILRSNIVRAMGLALPSRPAMLWGLGRYRTALQLRPHRPTDLLRCRLLFKFEGAL